MNFYKLLIVLLITYVVLTVIARSFEIAIHLVRLGIHGLFGGVCLITCISLALFGIWKLASDK